MRETKRRSKADALTRSWSNRQRAALTQAVYRIIGIACGEGICHLQLCIISMAQIHDDGMFFVMGSIL